MSSQGAVILLTYAHFQLLVQLPDRSKFDPIYAHPAASFVLANRVQVLRSTASSAIHFVYFYKSSCICPEI